MTNDPVIVALDFDSACKADVLVTSLGDAQGFYKVGMELCAAAGMNYVRSLSERGKRIFLDLKYYDIGETVKRADAGPAAILVTPGVQSRGAGDQKRVATPCEAVHDGADYVVIGREVTRSADPPAALAAIRAGLRGHR